MKKLLEELTLKEQMQVEKVNYGGDYKFTDDQFNEFIDQQKEFGVDQIEIELIDECLHIEVPDLKSQVYFFEDLIAKGEYIGPRASVSPLASLFYKGGDE